MNAFEVKIGMLYQFLFFIEPTLLLLHILQTAQFSTFCQDLGCTRAVKTRCSGTKCVPGVVSGDQGQEREPYLEESIC